MSSFIAKDISRDYIIEYWPNKGKEGAQIKDMYERLVKQNTASDKKPVNRTANGASNGVLEKQDGSTT